MKLKRKDLIQQKKTSKYDEVTAQAYNKSGKWSTCHLTNKALHSPIVSDYKGNLYNKDSILEYLLDPESITTNQKVLVNHITSLKDVVEIKIQQDDTNDEFLCPITGDVFGSNGNKYVYLVKCGDAFAEKCLKEISKDEGKCPVCNENYDDQDIIVMNSSIKEDLIRLEQRLESLKSQNLTHSLKKLKKPKHKKTDQTSIQHKSKKVKI